MKPCPVPLKVLCILGICWASLGLLGVLSSVVFYFLPLASTPAMAAMKSEPWYIATLVGGTLINLIIDLLLLFGAIKSLKAAPSGRRMLTIYAWSRLLVAIVSVVWTLSFVVPRTLAASKIPPHAPPGFEVMMKVGMYVGAGVGVVISAVMPVYILLTL